MPTTSLPARALLALGLAGASVLAGVAAPALAAKSTAKPCHGCTTSDTTPPSVSVSSPTGGSTVGGTVTVSGAAADNVSVAKVQVSIDGGPFAAASGTSSWSWSWNTSAVANGTHTILAEAVDSSGNAASASVTVNVSNAAPAPAPSDTTPPSVSVSSPTGGSTVSGTVSVAGSSSDNAGVASVAVNVDGGAWASASGTTSWTWSWATGSLANGSHTVTARATDTSGNTATSSVTVNVSNSTGSTSGGTSGSTTSAPNTQGSWVSPEGVHINVQTAGPFTISQIYNMLLANAMDLGTIGPDLTINVQDSYTSQTAVSTAMSNGVYSAYQATVYLQGVNSNFAAYPDYGLSHEYGHVWTEYMLYMVHNGNWNSYLNERWTTSDGSTVLATDSRLDSSYSWNRFEIIADDYRLLFGSSLAISEHPYHLNTQIPDPRNVTGEKDFLLNTWK